jgi:hypothetical protein
MIRTSNLVLAAALGAAMLVPAAASAKSGGRGVQGASHGINRPNIDVRQPLMPSAGVKRSLRNAVFRFRVRDPWGTGG